LAQIRRDSEGVFEITMTFAAPYNSPGAMALQCISVRCSALQCVAVCVAVCIAVYFAVCCSVLQCVAVCFNELQCAAVRCNMCCSVL